MNINTSSTAGTTNNGGYGVCQTPSECLSSGYATVMNAIPGCNLSSTIPNEMRRILAEFYVKNGFNAVVPAYWGNNK